MSGLITLGECSEAVTEIKNEHSENNWVIFGYNGKTNELKVEEKGTGGLEDFVENLNDGRIQYGYLRFAINQTFKYLFVSWCGGGVEGMRKGLFNNHTKEFENWLGQGGRGFHLQINARSEEDLTESIVLDKLNKVSSFIKASSLKSAAQDKDKLKQQSTQFWQQEKQQEATRTAALTAHDQTKQQNLAAGKAAEQSRLEKQAKETLTSMNQQRAANAQEFQQQQQERTAVQTKLQEDKRTQILGDQQRQKAASYTPVDAAHGVRAPAPAPGPRAAAPSPAGAPAPAPAVKKAPGRLAAPSAFTQPPPAAAPKPGPAKPFKTAAAPPPVSTAPKPAKPAPPVAPKPTPAPVYHQPEPEPEPAYEEPAYEEPAYEEPAYEEPAYQEPEQTYQEPEAAYQEEAYQEEYQEQPADGGYQYPQAKALYDYNAEAETDLSFSEGNIINILEDQDPSGWWKGEYNGAEGFFPSNFVERIN